ncbi:MAG: phosphoglycerate mutase [Nanoarchaeota archaeon]|nr:phosphoglycerate mutase [Nanoarchaeota archaeon]
MKGVLVILDGLGDLPTDSLEGKTPLESAETPNLNFLATRGETGYLYSVRPGFIPESDEAIVSIFGNEQIDSTRGQLEARGAGLELAHGDLAFRVNFATVDSFKSGNIIDRRAGRTLTTAEAESLAKALNKIKMPCSFVFKPTVQHRAALVFRGGFSDNISENDPTYFEGQAKSIDKVIPIRPMDDDENSQYTANLVNEFIEKAFEVLDKHPINEDRRKRGLLPANYLLIRGPGIDVPKIKLYRNWLSVAYMPLEKGFSQLSGMKVFGFDYPKLKGIDVYKNLWEGLKKACSFSIKVLRRQKNNFDYAYIHIKETDLPGHDNKPLEKKAMIEYLDKTLFKFLREFAPPNKINVVVTADHSTPCRLKKHSADPVPVLLYNQSLPRIEKKYSYSIEKGKEEKIAGQKFCEGEARKGSLGRMIASEMLKKVGFV